MLFVIGRYVLSGVTYAQKLLLETLLREPATTSLAPLFMYVYAHPSLF